MARCEVPPLIGARFMTTKPARSKCSTSRLATILAPFQPAELGGELGEALCLGGLRQRQRRLGLSVARRLAAILAADVVGYSRLMGEDEAGTAKAVSERREAARPTSRAVCRWRPFCWLARRSASFKPSLSRSSLAKNCGRARSVAELREMIKSGTRH